VRQADGTTVKKQSARHNTGLRWRARYVDSDGQEHTKAFKIKAAAQSWLDSQTAAIVEGKHIAPSDAKMTVREWFEWWLDGYQHHRKNTVQAAARVLPNVLISVCLIFRFHGK
jgi:hypothetical protein